MKVIVDPKWSKILKVVSYMMTILVIIGVFIAFPLGRSLVDKEIASGNYSSYDAELLRKTVNTILIIAVLVCVVLQTFVLIAGLKCANTGEWRAGAITFGIIFTVSEVFSFFKSTTMPVSLIMNLISLVLSILYLVAAVNCRPMVIRDDLDSNFTESKDIKEDEYNPF